MWEHVAQLTAAILLPLVMSNSIAYTDTRRIIERYGSVAEARTAMAKLCPECPREEGGLVELIFHPKIPEYLVFGIGEELAYRTH